jgi:nucleoside-diphosphate-sugar epimerase
MVYDRSVDRPLSEDSPLAENGAYGAAKLSFERATQAAVDSGMSSALILRPFTVYGHGLMSGDRGHFIGRWLELAEAGRPLTIYGAGLQSVDLVCVATVSDVCFRYISEARPLPLRTLNVTAGAPLSILDVAVAFQEARPDIQIQCVNSPELVTLNGWGDSSAMSEYLGQVLPSPLAALRVFLNEKLN